MGLIVAAGALEQETVESLAARTYAIALLPGAGETRGAASAPRETAAVWLQRVWVAGAAVSATNMSFDATIAPGGNVSYGYQGTWTANDTAPSSFSLNGTACA